MIEMFIIIVIFVCYFRFPEAVKPIKLGLSASKKRQCVAHHWPQTDIVIPETDPSQFEVRTLLPLPDLTGCS